MKAKFIVIFTFLFVALFSVACAAQPTATPMPPTPVPPTPTAQEAAQAIATLAATDVPTPTLPPTATPAPTDTTSMTLTKPVGTAIPDAVAEQEIPALLSASLRITHTEAVTDTTGITGVKVFKLDTPPDSLVYWVAYTYGLRNFDPEQNHVIAIYTQGASGWQEVTRQELKAEGTGDNSAPVPDYLGDNSVTQVKIEPKHLWLQLEGGVGAHSGIYGLFSFDGHKLKAEANGFSSSPGVGSLKDLNGDGIPEVLLDATDYYVFCYACGVRQVQYNILRWDDNQFVPVHLTALPDSAPAELRTLNEHLMTLTQAGLWKDALAGLAEADKVKANDPTFTWNMAYIRFNAEARRDVATSQDNPFPLLSQLFYGDYAAAVDVMRPYKPEDLFRADSPFIVGTVAEGNEDALADALTNNANAALQAQPNLAPAYFLRGWAAYRKDPNAPTALADLKQAASLAPEDTLYSQSVAYVAQNAGTTSDPQAAEVAATLAASLGITSTGTATNGLGLEGVHAFQLNTGEGGQPLWLAHTYGLRNFETQQTHVLAIYTPAANGWQEVARQALKPLNENDQTSLVPDYLSIGSLTQVKVEPEHIWIALEGGVGAHSGVFGLFSFDGARLKLEASSFSSSPGVGKLQDLNGDGLQEVVLDASDYYVFCYACGVREVQYNVLRWDSAKMITVTLTALPAAAPQVARDLNDNLITLAQAGLWKEALTAIQKAPALNFTDETLAWNIAYIRLNAEAKRAVIGNANDPYPLLSNVFYGDFTAAVDLMQKYKADQVFNVDSPLITGTVAAGQIDNLADALNRKTATALKVHPDLAAAYFLRGWATYLKTQDKAAALADIKQAAEFAPTDKWFAACVAYLEQ